MRRPRVWAWTLAVATLSLSVPAFARVPTRLVYSRTPAASDCPDESALAAAVAARLGYEPFSPWGDQTILATITRRGSELVARAELIDHDGIAQGSREVRLVRSECAELLLALALAISITLDPLRVDQPAAPPPEPASPKPEPEPDPEPEREEPPVATAPLPPTPPVDRKETRVSASPALSWYATTAGMGALEMAPQLAFGGRLGVAARRERWSLGVEAWGTLPSARAGEDGGEVRVRLLSAAVVPCFDLWQPLSLCGLASLGAMNAEGRGIDATRAENVLHATAGGRALLSFPLGQRFQIVANADLAAALNRPRFQLNHRDVWRPGPLVALFGVGVAARFF